MRDSHQVGEASLESELLNVVREIRLLEHRLVMLRSRDSANSRTLQAEITARLEERERRLAALRSTVQQDHGEPT
jgi:hypothetical protein